MFVISNLKVYILIKKKKKGYLVLCVAATMLFHQIICSISYLIHIILFTLQIILEPQSLLLRGKVKVKSLSCVQLFATPWTAAYKAPPSMGFSRQEYWCGLPFPSLGDIPNPGIEPQSPAFQADALTSESSGKPSTWMQSQKQQKYLCLFLRQTTQYHSNPSLCPKQ